MEDQSTYPLVEFDKKFNMADYFLDKRINEGKGDNIAIYYNNNTYTYHSVYSLSNKLAHALASEVGIKKGDRVGVYLRDRPEFIISSFAIMKIGACFIPVDMRTNQETVEYIFKMAKMKAVFVGEGELEKVETAFKSLKISSCKIIFVGKESERRNGEYLYYNDLVNHKDDSAIPVETDKDDIAFWGWTSGTTGMPKAAVHLHHDFPYNNEIVQRVFPMESSDITMVTSKLTFVLGQGINWLFPFAVGAGVVLFEDLIEPDQYFKLFEKHKPTIFTGLPKWFSKILDYYNAHVKDPEVFSQVKYFLCAGESLPVQLQKDWKAAFGKDLINCIGSTETCHWYITNRPDNVREGSLGVLCPGVQARILKDGKDVNDGEVGSLWIRTDSLAPYYYDNEQATKETMKGDGWHITGDQVKRDSSGFYWFEGREKDLFKYKGMFITPVEMASAVSENNECVKDCVVTLVKEEPVAFVVLDEKKPHNEDTKEEILENITATTNYRVKIQPTDIEFVDNFPVTDRNKVDAKQLQDHYIHDHKGDNDSKGDSKSEKGEEQNNKKQKTSQSK